MRCNYHPPKLSKEEQADFKVADNRSTLPLSLRLKYKPKVETVNEDFANCEVEIVNEN